MTRWLPFPLMSLVLLAIWLLLGQSLSTGQILLGLALAFGGALVLSALSLPNLRVRRPRVIVELIGLVIVDIIRSNIAVARIILGRPFPASSSGFVNIPLDLHAPYGLASLAIIITSTPGTLWVDFDSSSGILTIHVLDLVDDDIWIATIKQRYERRLMEIFQ